MQRRPMYRMPAPGGRRGGRGRLLLGLAIAAMALISYCSSQQYNPVTGENQYVSLTPHQEIALGLQAAPQMIQQYGGLYPDQEFQDIVDAVGNQVVQNSQARDSEYQFEFHLLDDPDTVNAFALPGGPVFITTGLLGRLETEGQLAAVLSHEIVHVLARHGAQRIAKADLTQGMTEAVVVASGEASAGQIAAVVGQLVNMSYGREDELESDTLGVRLMVDAGYDPRAMLRVMEILAEARRGGAPPEFFSTHPDPENRLARIQQAIQEVFPNGVPDTLTP